jgi:predicted DCC family thiol-disulfide oxidoreductase YuxK
MLVLRRVPKRQRRIQRGRRLIDTESNMQSAGGNWLLYDGDCPFCSAYVSYVRLRETAGPIPLLDARTHPDRVEEARKLGFDLDIGMVLKLDGRYYHAADCVHALALLTTSSGLFNRLNRVMFRSPAISRALYPVMRGGRNLALRLLGRRQLRENPARGAG